MKIIFRNATTKDSELLLGWRNDPETRKNSINSDPIDKNTHTVWLNNTLQSSKKKLFIATFNNQPVGVVRFDHCGNQWELSWTIDPSQRGRGIGKQVVKQATSLIANTLIAKVKDNNIASIKIAEHSGFVESHRKNNVIIYKIHRDET